MKIIDVSYAQGKINWSKVKSDGVEGAIIRAGYGKGNIDDQLYNNLDGAIKAGIKNIGIYWFSYAYTEDMAAKEARYCHDAIVKYIKYINLPVFFDWEYDSMDYAHRQGVYPDRQLITDMNRVFCVGIQSLGYKAGYYVNYDYSKNYVDCNQLKDWKKWYAQYTKKEQKDCYIWQYSSTGSVKGVSGNCDMNILWGTPDVKPVDPDIYKKSVDELAQEVIAGKYGNGAEREAALGDRYDEVQARVNEILAEQNEKTIDELAQEVIAGKYGDGEERKKALGDKYDAVQQRVNEILGLTMYGYTIGKTYKVVATNGLNIRTGAGTDFTKIGMLPYGSEVTVRDAKKVGSEIWVETDKGWMCAVGRGQYIG